MVKWSIPARNDLKQIHDYIAKDSKYYAQNVIQEIVTKTETLPEFPEIGRTVPEISDQNIRELIVYSYRLILSYSCILIFLSYYRLIVLSSLSSVPALSSYRL